MAGNAKRYRVTGAYATFKTMTVNGPAVLGFYRGSPVPADVEQESIDHHLRLGLIEEVPEDAAPAAAPIPGDKPGDTGQGQATQPGGDGKDDGKGSAGKDGDKGNGPAAATPSATTPSATKPAAPSKGRTT
jgi:hypothetical protein